MKQLRLCVFFAFLLGTVHSYAAEGPLKAESDYFTFSGLIDKIEDLSSLPKKQVVIYIGEVHNSQRSYSETRDLLRRIVALERPVRVFLERKASNYRGVLKDSPYSTELLENLPAWGVEDVVLGSSQVNLIAMRRGFEERSHFYNNILSVKDRAFLLGYTRKDVLYKILTSCDVFNSNLRTSSWISRIQEALVFMPEDAIAIVIGGAEHGRSEEIDVWKNRFKDAVVLVIPQEHYLDADEEAIELHSQTMTRITTQRGYHTYEQLKMLQDGCAFAQSLVKIILEGIDQIGKLECEDVLVMSILLNCRDYEILSTTTDLSSYVMEICPEYSPEECQQQVQFLLNLLSPESHSWLSVVKK